MKKNKTPWIFLIPVIALLIVVGIATVIKLLSPENATPADAAPREYPNPYGKLDINKPSTNLGRFSETGISLTPTSDPIPTQQQVEVSTLSTSADLTRELKNTVDDGGTGDLNMLEEEISGL